MAKSMKWYLGSILVQASHLAVPQKNSVWLLMKYLHRHSRHSGGVFILNFESIKNIVLVLSL